MTKNFKSKRTHDDFYLKEKSKVKEYYKFIISKVSEDLNNKDILDVGCSTGDFLKYIKTKYPKSNLNGIEITTGGIIIIPIAMSVDATIKSTIIKGINIKNPI